jgi:hypothetical protein
VKRDDAFRQEHHVLERKDRDPERHFANILDGSRRCRDAAPSWIRCSAPS